MFRPDASRARRPQFPFGRQQPVAHPDSTAISAVPASPRIAAHSELRTQVLDRLAELGRKFPIRIHVDVREEEVFLRGSVASSSQKLIVLHVVQSLQGVQQVHDQMIVGYRQASHDLTDGRLHQISRKGRWIALGGIGAVLLALGVWWGSRPAAARPVQARVIFEGKPPVGATVTLYPQTPRTQFFPYGRVQADGLVQWAGTGAEVPLPPGKYAATITWNRLVGGGDQLFCGPNLLPPHYSQKETTPLSVAVTKSLPGIVLLELKK